MILDISGNAVAPINYTGIIEYEDGSKEYRVYGFLHRADGPAIEFSDGRKEWFFNGKYHRDDGPAIEKDNQPITWFFDGQYYGNKPFSLKDLIIIDEYIGPYGFDWIKFIDETGKTRNLPDIPGLLIKD